MIRSLGWMVGGNKMFWEADHVQTSPDRSGNPRSSASADEGLQRRAGWVCFGVGEGAAPTTIFLAIRLKSRGGACCGSWPWCIYCLRRSLK